MVNKYLTLLVLLKRCYCVEPVLYIGEAFAKSKMFPCFDIFIHNIDERKRLLSMVLCATREINEYGATKAAFK